MLAGAHRWAAFAGPALFPSFFHSFSKHLSLGTAHCIRSRSAHVIWDSERGPEKYPKRYLLRQCILDPPPRPSASRGWDLRETFPFSLLAVHFLLTASVFLYIEEARL